MSTKGTVRWFNSEKGFGFIAPDEGGADVFAHSSTIAASGYRALEENQRVEFEPPSPSGGRFAASLASRGVPSEYFAAIFDAVEAVITPRGVLNAAERDFVRAAGVSDSTFDSSEESENVLFRELSSSRIERHAGARAISTKEVAQRLGIDAANVRRMASRRDVMTIGQRDGQSMYPDWQFVDGRALPGLRDVLAAFPHDSHPADIEQVMTRSAEQLGGRSPREWLATGGPVDPVVAIVNELSYV